MNNASYTHILIKSIFSFVTLIAAFICIPVSAIQIIDGLLTTTHKYLPKCSIDQDTYGEWRSMSLEQFRSNHTERVSIQQHFHGGGSGEAIHYSSIWLPHNCSYHRFTSSSIQACTKYTLDALVSSPSTKSNVPSKKLHIYFYGDSALRGIINGKSLIHTHAYVHKMIEVR
jgi:hypothetical protein